MKILGGRILSEDFGDENICIEPVGCYKQKFF